MFSLRSALILGSIATVLATPHGDRTVQPPPLPSSSLPAPDGLNLKVITLGVGHQNYTCNSTTGTFGSNVALADLFDVTHFLSKHPDQIEKISAERLEAFKNAGDCEEEADRHPRLKQIGDHYFEAKTPPVPDFDLFALNLFISGKKAAGVPAPKSGDVDWLRLDDNGNGETKGLKAVYRVETAGGEPPATCSGSEQVFVPYAAQYWFFD